MNRGYLARKSSLARRFFKPADFHQIRQCPAMSRGLACQSFKSTGILVTLIYMAGSYCYASQQVRGRGAVHFNGYSPSGNLNGIAPKPDG